MKLSLVDTNYERHKLTISSEKHCERVKIELELNLEYQFLQKLLFY